MVIWFKIQYLCTIQAELKPLQIVLLKFNVALYRNCYGVHAYVIHDSLNTDGGLKLCLIRTWSGHGLTQHHG